MIVHLALSLAHAMPMNSFHAQKPRKAGTRSVSAPQKPPVNVMRIKKYKQDGNTIDKNADVVSWKEDMLSISSTNFKFDEMANLLVSHSRLPPRGRY